MAGQPIPDNRTVKTVIKRLHTYNAYKSRQLQTAEESPPPVEDALLTVETWTADEEDSGVEWASRRQIEANRDARETEFWRDQVRSDEEQAEQEAEVRANLDMDKIKKDLKDQIDNYESTLRQQAKDGQPWAKKMLTKSRQENKEAREFIDQGLDKAMNMTSGKAAAQRRKRKLIAEKMDACGEAAAKWKSDYADQPAKWPDGQRDDVKSGLDTVDLWATQRIGDLGELGSGAARHIELLKQAGAWATDLKPRVDKRGAAMAESKAIATAGAADARAVMNGVEAYQNSLERTANEDMEQFRRWTDRNNALARRWIKSDSPKHRQWAEAWLKKRSAS